VLVRPMVATSLVLFRQPLTFAWNSLYRLSICIREETVVARAQPL